MFRLLSIVLVPLRLLVFLTDTSGGLGAIWYFAGNAAVLATFAIFLNPLNAILLKSPPFLHPAIGVSEIVLFFMFVVYAFLAIILYYEQKGTVPYTFGFLRFEGTPLLSNLVRFTNWLDKRS